MEQKKYNYFYKITNLLNNHYYYGIHSTDNLDDGYMGSGKRLHYAYKKYGIENFTKEIVKYFDTRKDASNYEAEMVTEQLVKDDNCYNCVVGGEELYTLGLTSVYDKIDNIVKLVKIEDYHNNKKRYISTNSGYVTAKKNGSEKFYRISIEEFYENRDNYTVPTTNKVVVKDVYNNIYFVSSLDPRYLSGELKGTWYNKKHKKEEIEKAKETFKKIKHQQGERNSHYGTCWVTKDFENKCVKIIELDKYIANGWKKGRYIKPMSDKYNNIDYNILIEMRHNGKTWVDISKKFGVSVSVLKGYRKAFNL